MESQTKKLETAKQLPFSRLFFSIWCGHEMQFKLVNATVFGDK